MGNVSDLLFWDVAASSLVLVLSVQSQMHCLILFQIELTSLYPCQIRQQRNDDTCRISQIVWKLFRKEMFRIKCYYKVNIGYYSPTMWNYRDLQLDVLV